jgi:hypothetical protein
VGNLVCWSLSWTVTSPPGRLPMRETQGAAAELASDGRSGRTRSTTRTDCKEAAAAAGALAIGGRLTGLGRWLGGREGSRSGGGEVFGHSGVVDRWWDG